MDADAADGRTGGIDVTPRDDGLLVTFWGVIDDVVRDRGTSALWDLRAHGGRLEIDCTGVAAMDSIGLSIVVRLVRDAVTDGQHVRFAGASAPVTELLVSSGVLDWMRDLGVELAS
jgi:anti-anti-sigma factor